MTDPTFALPHSAEISCYRLLSFETVGSTSEEAMGAGRRGEAERLWVVAGCQTAGRGRRGNSWATPDGNLAASLYLRSGASIAAMATLGFVAGLALVRALEACCPGIEPPFLLKWPNDVVSGGAKIAGILLESEADMPGMIRVVIGIGVNVAHAPDGLPYRATSLSMLGSRVLASQVFTELAAAWVELYQVWDEGRGFNPIRDEWLGRAAGLGEPISVVLNSSVLTGAFETIDNTGRLLLRASDGTIHPVTAGEVHFGPARTATPSNGTREDYSNMMRPA